MYTDFAYFRVYIIIVDEIALQFINNSPIVNGSTITADVHYNQPIKSLCLDYQPRWDI